LIRRKINFASLSVLKAEIKASPFNVAEESFVQKEKIGI
jgi:hypothetical protein